MAKARKRRAWWDALPADKRRKLREEQRREAAERMQRPMDSHTRQEDLACPGCGTDSTVGCLRADQPGTQQ
jgi:hypothetical protein